ncbi:hypothetical protein AV656_12125 [Bhargavaea cecembensis]|uniref:Uncharacterized protein n=1 Tax=Bhargavaea cecembensis TaxID=394098 RepID=A0A165GQU0_9BACL|nr:hypothetical protein AV656_12125 [Bhargavaea cecembensis]
MGFLLRIRFFFFWIRIIILVFSSRLGWVFGLGSGLIHQHFNKVGSDMTYFSVDDLVVFQGEFCIAADQLPETEAQSILQAA